MVDGGQWPSVFDKAMEEKRTDCDLIEKHQLRNARRNGPLVCQC